MRDEDHLAAATWNLLCAMATECRVASGQLPGEMNDIKTISIAVEGRDLLGDLQPTVVHSPEEEPEI